MNDHPTPAQLAAADAIDVRRYDGHTPWPWNSEYVAGAIRHLVRNCVAECFVFEDDWNAMNASGFYGWKKYEDSPLITDAPLLPVVVHQRDAARAERDKYVAACAALIAGDKIYAHLAEQDKQLRAERDALREKCRQLLLLAGVQEATIDEALAPPKDDPPVHERHSSGFTVIGTDKEAVNGIADAMDEMSRRTKEPPHADP